ncbi:hypothetical protein FD755_019383, partial [Muntiacus reevesi]
HILIDATLLLSNSVYFYQQLSLVDLGKIEIEASGCYPTLRAVMHDPEQDGKDALQCIAEMLQITKQAMRLDAPTTERTREKNQLFGPGEKFLMSKFSSLNKKVIQTKFTVNIVNFLKPNLKVNLWKSDSSLETTENAKNTDISIHVPSEVTIAHEHGLGKGHESSLKKGPSADIIYTLTGFAKPVDICCHRFVQDVQNKMIKLSETRSVSQQDRKKGNQMTNQIPSPPSQLDVSFSATGPQFVSVELGQPVVSQKTTSSKSSMLELETGLHVTLSPSESSGLTQGIKFAVANVQKSPAEPEVVKEVQQNELKNIFTQRQTRVTQI